MYDMFTYIYHKNQPKVGKYTSRIDPMGTCAVLVGEHQGRWTLLPDRVGGDYRGVRSRAKQGDAPLI